MRGSVDKLPVIVGVGVKFVGTERNPEEGRENVCVVGATTDGVGRVLSISKWKQQPGNPHQRAPGTSRGSVVQVIGVWRWLQRQATECWCGSEQRASVVVSGSGQLSNESVVLEPGTSAIPRRRPLDSSRLGHPRMGDDSSQSPFEGRNGVSPGGSDSARLHGHRLSVSEKATAQPRPRGGDGGLRG
jgi:hypothetical protein